jgi:hypothetical protein
VHKYTTSSSLVTIDGVRAKEPQIKRIPVIKANQRMPQKQKTRKTVAELASSKPGRNLQRDPLRQHFLTKTILKLLESKKRRDDEEDHSRDHKKGKRPL